MQQRKEEEVFWTPPPGPAGTVVIDYKAAYGGQQPPWTIFSDETWKLIEEGLETKKKLMPGFRKKKMTMEQFATALALWEKRFLALTTGKQNKAEDFPQMVVEVMKSPDCELTLTPLRKIATGAEEGKRGVQVPATSDSVLVNRVRKIASSSQAAAESH